MLTDFGSRWREWDIGRRKKERGEEEARILRGKEMMVREAELELKEQLNQPQQQPEEERPVPGMNGLTVEFVRELLCMCNKDMTFIRDDNGDEEEEDKDGTNNIAARSDDDNEEEIYSDRLPSGRYVGYFLIFDALAVIGIHSYHTCIVLNLSNKLQSSTNSSRPRKHISTQSSLQIGPTA